MKIKYLSLLVAIAGLVSANSDAAALRPEPITHKIKNGRCITHTGGRLPMAFAGLSSTAFSSLSLLAGINMANDALENVRANACSYVTEHAKSNGYYDPSVPQCQAAPTNDITDNLGLSLATLYYSAKGLESGLNVLSWSIRYKKYLRDRHREFGCPVEEN